MRRCVAGLVSVVVTACYLLGLASPAGAMTSAAVPQVTWRCTTVMPLSTTDLASPNAQAMMQRLRSDGNNCITIVITLSQSSTSSTDIGPAADTPTMATLAGATAYAHSIGLKVEWSIHNEFGNASYWRADINPSGALRSVWWNNELSFMDSYAVAAQADGVDLFCLGTEMIDMASNLANSSNGAFWSGTVIPSVRQRYAGLVTYDANRNDRPGWADEVDNISFWAALNGPITISAYYPVPGPSGWTSIDTRYLAPLVRKWPGKTILFGEAGYWPANGDGSHPWLYAPSGGYNEQTQSDLYSWLLQNLATNPSLISGVSWWDVTTDPTLVGPSYVDFTYLGRMAEKTLAQAWGAASPPVTPAPSTALTTWWPIQSAQVGDNALQPFKALIPGRDPTTYSVSWNVVGDSTHIAPMTLSQAGGAHFEACLDLRAWTWSGSAGSGPYSVDFVAKDSSGNVLSQVVVSFTVPHYGVAGTLPSNCSV